MPDLTKKESATPSLLSKLDVNDAVKLAAAVAILAISLLGVHYKVEDAGWGIFLAAILVFNTL